MGLVMRGASLKEIREVIDRQHAEILAECEQRRKTAGDE
jgi:hypothetical protein